MMLKTQRFFTARFAVHFGLAEATGNLPHGYLGDYRRDVARHRLSHYIPIMEIRHEEPTPEGGL